MLCFNRDLGRNHAVFALSNTLFQEQSYDNCRERVPAHQEQTWDLISWWKILVSVKRNTDLSVACIFFLRLNKAVFCLKAEGVHQALGTARENRMGKVSCGVEGARCGLEPALFAVMGIFPLTWLRAR